MDTPRSTRLESKEHKEECLCRKRERERAQCASETQEIERIDWQNGELKTELGVLQKHLQKGVPIARDKC